jgi:ElaB/YqjD/DUF883 family membrane-anchored ribosome-binding protein
MASSRSVQKEIENLRKEIAGLRQDYARLKNRAQKTKTEGVARFGAISEDLADTIAAIRDKVSGSTGAAAEEISEQLNELRDVVTDYTDKTEKTVAAHPLAAVAGAVAIGYLIGRFRR